MNDPGFTPDQSGVAPRREAWSKATVKELGSPLGLAALVLGLVSITGIVSTFTTYRSLESAGEARASLSLDARASRLRASLDAAFSVADPLLDRLATEVSPRATPDPIEPLFATMAELATARRGVTWLSVSFPDGTFLGVFHEGGRLFAQESRFENGAGVERVYRPTPTGAFERVREQPTTYDPRGRAFYRTALRRGTRTWTDPYSFLPDLRTGISRVLPLYRVGPGGRQLAAVLTVDFDAEEVAKLFTSERSGERYVVTVNDAVLATHGVPEVPLSRRSREHPVEVADLDDPVVREAVRHFGEERARFEAGGVHYRHERKTLTRLDGIAIELHAIASEDLLLALPRREARTGVLVTTTTSVFAILLAIALSRQIANLRERRDAAEREAERARAEADELGSYELLTPIGSGGMGEVWRARHKLLARDAALKLIKARDGSEDSSADRARFFDEAKLLASMRSIHTVAVYDFGIAADGRYFLAMELLDGLDLDALVRRDGLQPAARVAHILAQLCDSLAEAHAAGLVHQDIKPANVFLCRLAEQLDVVKVLDFGLTRAVGKRRSDGNTEGTPAFMSPEQARGEEVGPATDLYAVGCVGFFLLAGRFPYDGNTAEEYMRAHVSAPVPELPDSVRARIPLALAQIVARCMAKDPDKRPLSALALGTALRKIAAEYSDSFDDAARAAFWAKRETLVKPVRFGEAVHAATVRDVPKPATRRIRRSTAG